MTEILFCDRCNKHMIREICSCGNKAFSPLPQKFSPDDNYGQYRRKAKEEERKDKGLV